MKQYLAYGVVALILIIVVSLVLLLQNSTSSRSNTSDNLTVAATIFPLADIVQHVGGEQVEVIQLVPPGASPHSYEVTPQQVAQLQNTRALFIIDHGLDNWATTTAKGIKDLEVITVDKNIQLREFGGEEHEPEETDPHGHAEGSIDPHYWLTIPNAKQIARTVSQHLQELDPSHANVYEANLTTYLAELDTAEEELQSIAQNMPQKNFLAMHDAWSYFADHYGLHLVGTYEPLEGREPSLSDLQHLQSLVQTYDLTTFYAEPQKQSTSALSFLKKELGLHIKTLDAEGSGGQKSYIDLMKFNINTLNSH